MRNQRLVLIVLVALLLLGGAVAGYFFLGDDPPAGNGRGTVAQQDDPARVNAAPGNEPAIDRPDHQPGANDAPGPGSSDRPDGQPKATTPPTDGPGTVKEPPEPPVDTSKWTLRVTEHTITGRIVYKSDGRPAAGAVITAEANRNQWGAWGNRGSLPRAADLASSVEGSTTSDGAGEFTLQIKLSRRVPPALDEAPADKDAALEGDRDWSRWGGSEYVVVVGRMAGYAPARSGALYLGESSPNAAVNLSLAVPAALSGRVIDAVARKGIADATVTVYQADAGTDGWTAPRTTRTDKDGYFALTDLGAGTYMYSAEAEGYTAETAWRSGRRVDLSKGGETDVGEIPLLPAAGVIGQVVDGQTGAPVAQARVELAQAGPMGRASQHSAQTDAEGRFRFTAVGAGQYTLKAAAADYAPASVPNLLAEAGRTVDVGQVRLGRGFSMQGVVVDAAGKGVAGASVALRERGTGASFGWEMPGEDLGTATTGSNGGFSIANLAECPARITVTMDGFAAARQDVDLKPGMPGVTITLVRGVTVTGRVLGTDGRPAAEVTVGLVSHGDQAYQLHRMQPNQMRWFGERGISATTGVDGRFSLASVPPDTYLLLALPAQGKGASQDNLKVADGGDLDVGDLTLPGPGTVRVTVTEAGQPVAGLRVELRSGFGGWAGGGSDTPAADTDAGGVALFADVPAGEVFVTTARDKDNMDTEIFTRRRVAVKSGQVTEFRLELKPADTTRLHGRATLNGKPLFTEIMLLGTGERASFFKQTKPDEAGYFEVNGVQPGQYVLHFRVGDKQISCLHSVSVDKPGELEINRDFAGYAVGGKVATPANSPAERASVRVSMFRLNDPSPEQFVQWLKAETPCNADGNFRFEHVPPGSYRLTASLEGVGSTTQDITVTTGDLPPVSLELAANSGKLRVTIRKVNGTPLTVQNFGMVQLRDGGGSVLAFEDQSTGFVMVMAGAQAEIPTVPAGTYTLVLHSAGCLMFEKSGVAITTGNRTEVDVELTAAAELHLTVTNTDVTQEMLDRAQVKYFDAQGAEIPRTASPFEAWGGGAAPQSPTLRAGLIGPSVAQVRVKLPGFAELQVAIEFEAGKKIEKQETLVAG